MEAVLSIDTTKGNSVINVNGFAVSQTVKEGYILRYSSDILDIMQRTTGKTPYTFGSFHAGYHPLRQRTFSISTAFCSPPQRLPPQ